MRFFRDASVRTKLNFLTTFAVSAALGLCCTVFVWKDVQTLNEVKRGQVSSLATVIGANTISAIEFDDRDTATETLASLSDHPSVELAVLYDSQGAVFATYPQGAALDQDVLPLPRRGGSNIVYGPTYMQMTRRIQHATRKEPKDTGEKQTSTTQPSLSISRETNSLLSDNDIVGTVPIRSSLRDIRAEIANHVLIAGVILIDALGMGFAVSRVFQQMITVPIRDLMMAARRIAANSDYSHRVRKHGEDEHGVLCDAFNAMLTRLECSRDELQRAHDVLDQRVNQRAAELESTMREALAANRAKSDFLANMSHEIRTPMIATLGYTDLLTDEASLSLDGRERIGVIHRNGQHLINVINDILDMSKIEAGMLTVEHVECSIFNVIADLLSLIRCRATEKGLALEVRYRGDIPEIIFSDPTRIHQVLLNLIGNAIKFTERGFVRLVVSMTPQITGQASQLKFEVIDTGVGMSKEQAGHVFLPFSQGDETMTRRFGGTGLGLTISQGLAQLLGGTISVESIVGAGSKFTLTINPGSLDGVRMVTNGHEAYQPRAKLFASADTSNSNAPSLQARILLVEDGIDNQRLISLLLRNAGAEVDVAENGQNGFDIAMQAWQKDRPYDIIFMDMQMPVLDGYAATKQLRQAHYSLPIIALTAHAMMHDRDKCLASGCDDYYTKPVDCISLLQLAARWIEQGRCLEVT